ncbi:insulinase family protein [Pseudodesulfovibrio cashew]|uniref:Insulinase family protein n=1 Tax=Pseudodesulfovibrio cashew TaxID=2678688 RepID=A0A6I6JKK4_9BACT|nr:pitrilysin family protein [Pseudodesulfovibrio cashew]QGY40843.1 insulinase family protein [Pseudodesulfovibrio cashew]
MFRKLLMLTGMLALLVGCQSTMKKNTDIASQSPATALPSLDKEDGATHLVRLSNGLTVLIKEDDRFPLVNTRLYVHAGSAYETPDIAGISHQLEHMVFKGTKKRGMGESARAIEAVGGNVNAATSFDYTVYYAEVPDNDWKLGMDVITDMAFNASIDPVELESEKKVVLSELKRGEDSPGSKLFKTLQHMVWKGTPYEWPIIGYPETVGALTREKIKAYIGRLYQPQSMLLAVVGKVDPQEVLAEAERLLGSKQNTGTVLPPEPFVIPEAGQGPKVVTLPGKWNKVYMGVAFPIPHSSSAEYAGLDLLSQLLGGDDTSRYYRKFKYDLHLVDSISVSPLALERGGMLYISATMDADKVDAFWRELTSDLASFDATVFTDREIDRARLNLEDSLFLAKETLSGLASKTAFLQFFENGEQGEKDYLFALNQADRSELQSLYDEYVRPDRMASAVLLPEQTTVKAEALEAITEQGWPVRNNVKKAKAAAAEAKEQVIDLPNGNRLVLLPDATLPYTAMSLYWTGGDGELTPDQEGLASLTAKALTRGTLTMSATEVQEFLADHAASLGASAGRNIFAVEAKFPTRFTGDILPLLTDVLTSPSFDLAEVDRSKQDQIAAIKSREDRPLGLAFRHLFPFLYKSGPYALLHQGTPEEVEKLGQSDIMRFWGRQAMQPMTIAVCGQFDPAAIESFAKTISTALTAPVGEYEFATPEWGTEREATLTLQDRNQAHLLMVFPTPGKTDKDDSARLELLKAALSGQSGLLFNELRDKQGLGYTVTSLLWQSRNTGFIALYIGTKPDTVEQSLEGFRKVIADLSAKVLPEDELTRAKNILTGDYYQEQQSLLSRSRQAASLMARGFERNYEQDIIERAQTVTPEQVREVVRKYMNPDKAYLMKVLP